MRYSPWHDAAERHPGVHIERCGCKPLRGAWIAEQNVVLLDVALLRADRDSTLAHEIAHIDLAHAPTGIRWFDRRQEAAADTLAADRLVDLDELASVLRWALGPDEVAAEIGVTEHMVKVRVRNLTDAERAYIDARLASLEATA